MLPNLELLLLLCQVNKKARKFIIMLSLLKMMSKKTVNDDYKTNYYSYKVRIPSKT